MDIPFYSMYQIMMSNYLKVEDENTVLGFIFHFTQNLQFLYPSKTH